MMYATKIRAINPLTGELATFGGPNIKALSPGLAHEYCQMNGLGYCEIDGQILCEIPCDENYKSDWSKAKDYDLQLN